MNSSQKRTPVAADLERLETEREIARDAYAKADNERLRLLKENEELRLLLTEGGMGEVLKQLKEAREVIEGIVKNVCAPMHTATGKAARVLRPIIKANEKLLNLAVAEIYKLRQ